MKRPIIPTDPVRNLHWNTEANQIQRLQMMHFGQALRFEILADGTIIARAGFNPHPARIPGATLPDTISML